jgi:tRNA dimethylallyltransferase
MIYVIGGPTGTGKTSLAIWLARYLNAPLINADAFQVYKGMDIGTNKELSSLAHIQHYLFDITTPDQGFTVAKYQALARPIIESFLKKNIPVIMVGGTGLYLKATLYDFQFVEHQYQPDMSPFVSLDDQALYAHLQSIDPMSASLIHPNNRRRVLRAISIYLETGLTKSQQEAQQEKKLLYPVKFYAIEEDRLELYQRINQRVEQQFKDGLIEEVKSLLTQYPEDARGFDGIGYKEVIMMIKGEKTLEETKELMKQATRRYAKRQFTYFKHQLPVQWFASIAEAKEGILHDIHTIL